MRRYRTYCFSLPGTTHAYLKGRAANMRMTQSEFIRGLIREDLSQPLPPHPDSPWRRHHADRHPLTIPVTENLAISTPMA